MLSWLIGSTIFATHWASLLHHGVGSLFIWINLSRCWQLFYNNKYYEALSSKAWRSYINPKESNWFLKHRHTIGNYPIISGACISFWLFDVFAYCFLAFLVDCSRCIIWAEFPAYGLFYILAILIIQQSKISDIFYIKQELKLFIAIMILGSIFSLLLNLWTIECDKIDDNKLSGTWYCSDEKVTVNTIQNSNKDYDNSFNFILAFIAPGFVGCLVSCIVVFIGIHWVVIKNKQREKMENMYKRTWLDDRDDDTSMSTVQNRYMTLKDVLEDRRALEMFMQHLILLSTSYKLVFAVFCIAARKKKKKQEIDKI